MTGAGYGGVAGAAVGGISSIIGLSAKNKAAISSIEREGRALNSNLRQINYNREQLDRELGDILSDNALATAKNMATAKAIMSTSGTVGGTSSLVAKQAYISQIQADAATITRARNQDMNLLTQALTRQIAFRSQSSATVDSMGSPMEAMMGTLMSSIGGASQGASIGNSFGGKAGGSISSSFGDGVFKMFGSTTTLPSINATTLK